MGLFRPKYHAKEAFCVFQMAGVLLEVSDMQKQKRLFNYIDNDMGILGLRYPLAKSPGANQKPIWLIEFSINSPKNTFLASAPG